MTDISTMKSAHLDDTDDLSDTASSLGEVQTLHEEELPGYSAEQHELPREAITTPPPVQAQQEWHDRPEKSGLHEPAGPTTSSPFDFPSNAELPSYSAAAEIIRPIAIPQIHPAADAPLLPAYSPQLLHYGIPATTWYSFVDTLSAFISANISQQAVHHAADIGSRISDFHKQYALSVRRKALRIGQSAKSLNPVAVVHGAVGLTLHSVGHVLGSVFHLHSEIWSKPKTPRERAIVYVAAANNDWFHQRGLHALLLDTMELAVVLGIDFQHILTETNKFEYKNAAEQLASLRDVIAELEVRKEEQKTKPREQEGDNPGKLSNTRSDLSASASSASGSASDTAYVTAHPSAQGSNAAGKRPADAKLWLGAETLWLVVTQESKIQAMEEVGITGLTAEKAGKQKK